MPLSGAMHRRGGVGSGGTGSTLPMTNADAALGSASSTRRRRRGNEGKSKRVLIGQIVFLSVLFAGVFLYHRHRLLTSSNDGKDVDGNGDGLKSGSSMHSQRRVELSGGEAPLPLDEFPSLSYALSNANLVALYFAAAWCPMSTPVTQVLEAAFSGKADLLLDPKNEGGGEGGEAASSGGRGDARRPLAIVYVSSDKSDEEMREYSRRGWIDVPFDSPDRNGLKRHFRVCAKRELEELGFDRKMEIPTLIIIDSMTQGVLTTSGVDDLKEYGEKALDHWKGLQSLIRSLEDKYEHEERDRFRARRPERIV